MIWGEPNECGKFIQDKKQRLEGFHSKLSVS